MRTILFILFPLYRCYSMTNTTSRVFFINEQYPRSVFECTKEKWAHKKTTKEKLSFRGRKVAYVSHQEHLSYGNKSFLMAEHIISSAVQHISSKT